MKVIVYNPDRVGKIVEVENKLETWQNLVGGYIECVHIADGIEAIIDEEGKLKGYPINRRVMMDGQVIDYLVGPVVLVKPTADGDWEGFSDDEIQSIKNKYNDFTWFIE